MDDPQFTTTCPYCGHKHINEEDFDSYVIVDGEITVKCGNCKEEFNPVH